jgi:hypothetical protein
MGCLEPDVKCCSTGSITRDVSQSAGRGKSLRTPDITSNRDIAIESELLFQFIAVIREDNQL